MGVLSVSEKERVARILSTEWFVDGVLQNLAFTLLVGETYISVNRPTIDSYDSDVVSFVEKHPKYAFGEGFYRRAILNVREIRDIKVNAFGEVLNVDVEVEPRDTFTRSHAGIFTRYGNRNVKPGDIFPSLEKGVSADDILMKVRSQLMKLSTIEHLSLCHTENTEITDNELRHTDLTDLTDFC